MHGHQIGCDARESPETSLIDVSLLRDPATLPGSVILDLEAVCRALVPEIV